MSKSRPTLKSQWLLWSGALVGVCIGLYALPLFHIVPLRDARRQSAADAFDAAAFVEKFWNDLLQKAATQSVDAGALLAALSKDPGNAANRYGHRLGLSTTASYLVSGHGRITAVGKGFIEITLEKGGTVVIDTGPVFGNAIRDGSGLLNVSHSPNSQSFNEISSKINARVEERVFPFLKQKATVGTTVSFLGGVDIADGEKDISTLNLVPVVITFP